MAYELPEPADLLREYSTRAKKRFGQHFLTDSNILDRIVAAAGVQKGDHVLEIGPGCGTLTTRLLRAGARVTAVEIDRDAAAFLRDVLGGYDLDLIEDDALSLPLDPSNFDVSKVAANLPYNIGTRVLFRLLESSLPLKRLAVMLQREVADRIVAEPRTKAYGAMTLQVAELAASRIEFRVKPGSFIPPPKVDSAVVVLEPHETPRIEEPELSEQFRRVVTAGFAMRRKTLRNSLGAVIGKDVAARVLEDAGVQPRARAEELGFDEFLRVATATQQRESQ